MAKRPYIKLYVDDFFGSFKVQGMNAEQIGAYFLMLMAASQEPNIDLLDDDDYLAQVTRLGKNFKKNSHVLKNCFVSENGRLYNNKLRNVLVEYDNFVERQRVKSAKGVKARQPTGNPRVTQAQPTGNPTITITKTNNHNIKETNKEKAVFTKPTWIDVAKYIFEYLEQKASKDKIAAEAKNFIDYYESKGWLVGKSPMKNWQASARRWFNDKDVSVGGNNEYKQPPKRVEQTKEEKDRELAEITERLKQIK